MLRVRAVNATVPTEPPPPIRTVLLQAVRRFVEAASRLPEVRKIALVGSLTTPKPLPKDADVLVVIEPQCDLTRLAELGRKLKGQAQQRNHGADIFLAVAPNQYIGRTCHWRECGPWIRASCRAQRCGRREYLNDDLQVVRLAAPLVEAPPIELWPAVVRRVPVPDDVAALLLDPLQRTKQA